MRIYLDVDDTLGMFREYCVLRGIPRWTGSWYTTDRSTWTPEQCHIQDATNRLMQRDDFWSNIPVAPRAHELIASASFHGEVRLLTALPSSVPASFHDDIRRAKVQWAWQQLHVPPEHVIVCNRVDKVRFAFDQFEAKQSILVDDAEQTCREWVAHDGIAHHFAVEQGFDYAMAEAINFIKCL